ncbi:MAG: hypothetical protein ACLFR1_02345 [Spirochaetia bacterium]
MDIFFYLITAVLTIGWSVWIYILWEELLPEREDSGARFILIIAPSAFFLLAAVAGWQGADFLRLDLIALILLDAVTVFVFIIMFIAVKLVRKYRAKLYLGTIVFYIFIAGALSLGAHVIRNNPALLIRFSYLVHQLEAADFLSFSWVALNPQTNEVDFIGILNKLLIAAFSYVPIALIRFAVSHYQQRQTKKQVECLEKRICSLEQIIIKYSKK